MSQRPCVHVVRGVPVTDVDPAHVKPLVTVDLRVFYPHSESGFSEAVTCLGIAYLDALEEIGDRYEALRDRSAK